MRHAFKMKLKPGCVAEYKKRHDEIWPELSKAHSDAGIPDSSIYFDEETRSLFAVQKLLAAQEGETVARRGRHPGSDADAVARSPACRNRLRSVLHHDGRRPVTVLSVADALKHVPAGRELDGVDLMPVLQGGGSDTNRTFGWRRRDWGTASNDLRQETYRKGDWKFLRTYENLGDGHRGTNSVEELYHLGSDIGEVTNLAATATNTFEELRSEFAVWKTNTVDLDAEFLIWTADQMGSPDQTRLDAYLPTALNPNGNSNVPNPLPNETGFDLFDFTWDDYMQGKLLDNNNTNLVSEPVISNGVFSVEIQPGCVAPYLLLYRISNIDTSRFQVLKVRLRITGATEPTLGAEVLLRDGGEKAWSGEDLPFTVVSDGQWHEYAIDCSLSTAWALWTLEGKIGL